MFRKHASLFFFFIGCLLTVTQSYASHLRAADIQLIQLDGTRYRITLSIYTEIGEVTIDEDIEEICIRPVDLLDPNNRLDCITTLGFPNSAENTFSDDTKEFKLWTDYDFANPGRYIISWNQIYRNGNIANLGETTSDQVSMYIETHIKIGGSTPENDSPQLTIPPIDKANVGELFVHNPGAYDPDGDSLIFELTVPQAIDYYAETEVAVDPKQYTYPSNPKFGGASDFSIDPVSGIITWDTPNVEGLYVIAFKVSEVRNGLIIGYVTRDMQIIVENSDNKPPVLELPPDRCAVSGSTITDTIKAYDPNKDNLKFIEEHDLPKDLGAFLTPIPLSYQYSIASLFSWDVTCEDVKEVAYLNSFKVTDFNPNVPLSDSKNRTIKVIGEAPQNLVATAIDTNIQLTWDAYPCSNISTINIYRRDCEIEIEIDSCTGGVPTSWGFTLIAQVSPTDTSYLDENLGFGLNELINYSYLIYADFVTPQRGKSYASNLATASINVKSPIIYQVSADTTTLDNPQNIIKWQAPLVDLTDATTQVDVLKTTYEGSTIIDEEIIASFTGTESLDSSYIDTVIDAELYYEYAVTYNSTEGTKTSSYNSVVLGEAVNTNGTLTLAWDYNTAWSGADSLNTYIWRVDGDTLSLLDSVNSFIQEYEDVYVSLNDTFCYIVETHGVFCHDSLFAKTINFSQKFCGVPLDSIPPCPPVASIIENDCDRFDASASIENNISWLYPASTSCQDSVIAYKLYEKINNEYILLDLLPSTVTNFIHSDLETYAKCYVVSAIDLSHNESTYSNEVCNDNCEQIKLPNLITPGIGDGNNDTFNPFPEMRFVNSIDFQVYNRWGNLVYESFDDIDINWDGTNSDGAALSPGIYFYVAHVTFDKLNSNDATREIKGWVQIF